MTCVSGIGMQPPAARSPLHSDHPSACVVGSSIICVDLIIRLVPSKRNFRIQDSNAFLSSSLSLSFGVMVSPTFPLLKNGLIDVGIPAFFFSL